MGCCCSKQSEVEEQEEPNVTTPLLPEQGNVVPCRRRVVSFNQEFSTWNSIIHRASRKMINASPFMNPLNADEIEERRKKYTDLLNRVQPRPAFSTSKTIVHEQKRSTVIGVLTEAKPNNINLADKMSQLRRALKYTLVVGDIVVPMQPLSIRRSRSS